MARKNKSFADQSRVIIAKYKKRLGENLDGEDLPAREAMNRELEQLRAEQELARADMFNTLFQDTEMACGGSIPKKASGGSIHIKPENKGKFTESAKRAGRSVQEHARAVLANPNATPLQKKRANFARNAASWKHEFGGELPEMSFGSWLKDAVGFIFTNPLNKGKYISDLQKSKQAKKWANEGLPELTLDQYNYTPTTFDMLDYNNMMQYNYAGLSADDLTQLQSQGIDPSALSLLNLATIDPSALQTVDFSNIDTSANVERIRPELLNLAAQRSEIQNQAALNRSMLNRSTRNLGANRINNLVAGLTSVDRSTGNQLNQSYLNEQLNNIGAINQARQFNAASQNQANLLDIQLLTDLASKSKLYNADLLNNALTSNVGILNQQQVANADMLNKSLYYNTDLLNTDKQYNAGLLNNLAYYNNNLLNKATAQNTDLYNTAYASNIDIANQNKQYNDSREFQAWNANNAVNQLNYENMLQNILYSRGQFDTALANRVQWGYDNAAANQAMVQTILPLVGGNFNFSGDLGTDSNG